MATVLLAAPSHAGTLHQVRQGETLWSIAHSYGTRVEDLMAANGLDDPECLESGASLTIPGDLEPARDPIPLSPASFAWPLDGVLTRGYGARGHHPHSGIDVAAPLGTIVVASAPGHAVRAGDRWGHYGIVVLIDHGQGFETLYAHCARVFVHPGEDVYAGQAVAAVGRTGNATGPHLHFELWQGGGRRDPLAFLRR